MAKNDFTTKIEDGRIMFMTSYRDEFGETKEVANIITKDRLIEIRDDINRALAELSDENSNCNIPVVKVRYLLIEWINGNPVIDGCMHFDTKDECLEYYNKLPKIGGVEYTVCRTNAP